KLRYVDANGAVFQATLLAGGSEIHLIDVGPDHWEAKGVSGPVGQLTVVYVDDVDSQYERVSVAAGPHTAVSTPQNQPYGARVFTVTDVGGNSWTFWQEISDTVELAAGRQVIRAERTCAGQDRVSVPVRGNDDWKLPCVGMRWPRLGEEYRRWRLSSR